MVTFEHGQDRYRVWFKHENNSSQDPKHVLEGTFRQEKIVNALYKSLDKRDSPRAKTLCEIQRQEGADPETGRPNWVAVATGWANCSWFDNFVRAKGRQIAFERAIKDALKQGLNPLVGAIYVASHRESQNRSRTASPAVRR